MKKKSSFVLSFFTAFFIAALSSTNAVLAESNDKSPVTAELISEKNAIEPGKTFTVGILLKHAPHWHTYWLNPGGEIGLPTTVEWQGPEGFSFSDIQWPQPQRIVTDDIVSYGYENTVLLLTEVTPPQDLPIGKTVKLTAEIDWLMCKDVCEPGSASVELSLPISEKNTLIDDKNLLEKIDQTRMQPQMLSEWDQLLQKEENTFILTITPPVGKNANFAIKKVHFFSNNDLIPAASIQAFSGTENSFRLLLTPDPLSTEQELSGLLYAENSWLTDNTVSALSIKIPLAEASASTSSSGLSLKILLLAFTGGLILNLMPCVFPVIGIKIMGFVQQAGEKRHKVTLHGFIFTLGVLISFWLLASALIVLRAQGAQLGWGFQLQSPAFVYFLVILLFLFALNLAGLFEIGTSAVGVGSKLTGQTGFLGSFFSGVLATVVATPCAAPFLAVALGTALTLAPAASLLIFTVIGLGLSFPYLILSAFPKWVSLLPRPGSWMETFKQIMSFPLFATVAFLVWVLAAQVEEYGLLWILLAMTLIALAGWIYGRWTDLQHKSGKRLIAQIMALGLIIGAVFLGYPQLSEKKWQTWSPELVTSLQKQNRPIYVDFTARWCATCQTNKAAVFGSQGVLDTFKKKNVALLKADWTNRDPLISETLKKYGRSAVPFNLAYLPGQEEPIILPTLLTPGVVLEAFETEKLIR